MPFLRPCSLLLLLALLPLPAECVWGSDLLWSPVEVSGGPVDSAGALRAELESRGRIVVLCDSLTGFVLEDYDAIWVCLGVFPYSHPLSLGEGLRLKQYLLQGGTLMIEGGDIWGYDILTPLNSIDGIAASADGGSDLHGIQGVAGENGVDLSAYSATYVGERSNLDHIYADAPGASVVFSHVLGNYDVGVLHDGGQSNLGDFRVLGISFEFGGWGGSRSQLLEGILIALDLEADCTALGPTLPRCDLVSQGTRLSWTNLSTYSTLEVLRDGVTVAVLPPTFTSHIDLSPPGGRHEYRLRASDGECQWVSGACFIDHPEPEQFRRGDLDRTTRIDLSDAILLLRALFVPNSPLLCPDSGDVNDSGVLDIADAILLLRHIFEGATPPSNPHPNCGIDPTDDELATCNGHCP